MNKRTVYTKESLKEISFPLGGIGTGCIGLAGNGSLIDWEIFNRPDKGGDNGFSHFAVKASRGGKTVDARVLCADDNSSLTGTYAHGYGDGKRSVSMQGFPHFRDAVFTGEFPVATVDFKDDTFPGCVRLTGWNPLIPLNDRDSGIPAAFIEISVTNPTAEPLDYSISASLRNPSEGSVNEFLQTDGGSCLVMRQTKHPADSPEYREMTLATNTSHGVSSQEYWYRGGWNDGLERYWRNFTEQTDLTGRTYDTPGNYDTGTISVRMTAAPGGTVKTRFVIAWYAPNCYNYWSPHKEKAEDGEERDVIWKNYYASLFRDSSDAARYALSQWDRLMSETTRYHDALFGSSLPENAAEALASAVSVLKSPTVMRLENGEFYGWEGVRERHGSCEGTCTHVWNYAYALCFLFPQLERSIRETDFKYNQDQTGRMAFRMQLPLGRERSGFRACVDGQMGGVIKTYREWKLSGDDAWLRALWPQVKKSLEYAWSEENPDRWDRDQDGVLEGRQHHTLDMELFGPSSWLEGFYLAALKCGAEMARRMGEEKSAEKYESLFRQGKARCDENLFNGKWYCQKIDLADEDLLSPFPDAKETYWNAESGEIKYQIGEGCEIDQCLAQWHANLCGIGEIYDKKQLRTALRSIYENNFLPDMRSHYNTFRLFAVNDESGTVICSFPDGVTSPAIPIPYAQETMHGFEYALAGLMISEGMIDEGMRIVTSVRDRYRGFNRNPFNEIECGNNYARSMASFALLPIFSGFSFDLPDGALGFDPVLPGDFRAPWFAGGTWGGFERTEHKTVLTVNSGTLRLSSLKLPYLQGVRRVLCDGREIPFSFRDGELTLTAEITGSLTVETGRGTKA
ncbi:MAG: hypothetical protein IJL26_07655 [Clostridia bacterium]|nr:hypothetical protein [Clostridia bacterium]